MNITFPWSIRLCCASLIILHIAWNLACLTRGSMRQFARCSHRTPAPRAAPENASLPRVEGDGGSAYYWVFPDLILNYYPDHPQVNIAQPITANETHILFE